VLELGDGAQNLEEHPADGDGSVDALVEHDQVDAADLEVLGQLVYCITQLRTRVSSQS
jgi:hypothetical protein